MAPMKDWPVRTLGSLLLVLMWWCAVPSEAKKKKKSLSVSSKFDYYVLALAWAPSNCASAAGTRDPRECGMGRKVGFEVHGLWPLGNTSRGPASCSSAAPVPPSTTVQMLSYIPTENLIQHEWTTHGTCSGLSQYDYFAAIRKARDSVAVPEAYRAPDTAIVQTPAAFEAAFMAANPGYPKGAFRSYCAQSGQIEMRVCFSKDITPQPCTESAGACGRTLRVLPVR
jgi:ribonuclease T2